MFAWLDNTINAYFEKRSLEVDREVREKMDAMEATLNAKISEAQSKLESHCNLHFEMSKEKYEKKREEFSRFAEDACERLKNNFTEECGKQDLKKLLQECFDKYASGIDFSLRPRIVDNRANLTHSNFQLIKTTSFSKQKEFFGGRGVNKELFIESCLNEVKTIMIEEALDIGAKLGSDIMLPEIHSSEATNFQSMNYGDKSLTVSTIINVDYYKSNGGSWNNPIEESIIDMVGEAPLFDLEMELPCEEEPNFDSLHSTDEE